MSQHDDLYDRFTTQVDTFANHREKIAKAQALEGKYRAEVVKKVVDDHTERSMAVVSEIMGVLFEVESTVEELGTDRSETDAGTAETRNKLEELELNLMIEAISQEDFDTQSGELKDQLTSVDEKLAAIDVELERFNAVLGRWNELGTEAGVLQ